MAIGLTPALRHVLLAIQDVTDESGQVMTLDEIASRLGGRTKGWLSRQIHALEERGWLSATTGRPRCVTILHRLEQPEPEIVGLFDAPRLFARDLTMLRSPGWGKQPAQGETA